MDILLQQTTAYLTIVRDKARGTLSHAYMLWFSDDKNLRYLLVKCATAILGDEGNTLLKKRIADGVYPDAILYPDEGKKFTVEGISAIIDECSLAPREGNRKVVALIGFEQAAPLVQNKLLKILEEPPENVMFLLGVTSTAPVLDTILSRVKMLTIPPFAPADIEAALERQFGKREENRLASVSCGGSLGVARGMIEGGWFNEIHEAALAICLADSAEEAANLSARYGDTSYKTELLAEMQRLYFAALSSFAGSECDADARKVAQKWQKPTLIFAEDLVTRAATDVKFNAYFAGLLYDFVLRVKEENKKWLKW